jgi:hypothetical protein
MPEPRVFTQTFIDERVDLTGGVWKNCLFNGCVVELRAGQAGTVMDCVFEECQLVGDGWPGGMVFRLG